MLKVRKKPCRICRRWFQPDPRVAADKKESMLSAAGFKMVPAETPEKLAHAQSLPQLKVQYYTDADGTGQNNLFKYVAGLDPTNPNSVFLLQINAVTNQLKQDNLLFNPLAGGRTYKPQFNTDLVNGAWLPLAGYLGPIINGNQVTITDTNATPPKEFYRIDISLP